MDVSNPATARPMEVLETRLSQIARELRLQRKRMQREARGQDAVWQTACLVHWLAPGEPGAAMAFLERHRPRDATVVLHWPRQLEIAEAQTPEAERSRLTTAPGTAAEHRRLKRAASWLQEFGLHSWIDNLNLRQGIAPVTGVVLQEVERRRVSAVAEAPGVHVKAKHRQQWLRRWRRRWGICLARLLPGQRLPPEACARKATASQSGTPSRPGPKGGDENPPPPGGQGGGNGRRLRGPWPESGAIWRPPNWGRIVSGQQGRGPENGPVFDPVFPLWRSPRRPPCGPGALSCTTRCRRTSRPSGSTSTRRRFVISRIPGKAF